MTRRTAWHNSCSSRRLAGTIDGLGGELEKLETDMRTRGVVVSWLRGLLQRAPITGQRHGESLEFWLRVGSQGQVRCQRAFRLQLGLRCVGEILGRQSVHTRFRFRTVAGLPTQATG